MTPRIAPRLVVFWLIGVSAPFTCAQEIQSWNEIDFAATWKKVDLLAPALARVDTERPNPQFASTGIQADLHLPANLTLTAGYLFVELPPYSTQVHAPLVAVSASIKTGRLTLSDRNRFERLFGLGDVGRHAGLGASPERYRNRLQADVSPLSRWHIFAGDEVFYDFEVSRWNQNRAQGGAGMRMNKRLLLDVYFLQQSLRHPNREIPVVGSTLRVWLTPARN
jgi:hypothetical protein